MSLLTPTSIAIIGASSQEGKVGHDILKNLVTQGYAGKIFPVNPKGGEILGKKVYVSIEEISDEVDLVIIVIPAALTPTALEECGKKKIPSAIVISAGFTEVHTDEGKKLEAELVAIAKKYSITLLGPNCLGLVRPSIKMNASFAKDLPPAGNVAFVSQSGATAVALMDRAPEEGIGFSLMASIGNKAALDECDLLEMCEKDDETTVIGFYLESIRDGRRFREIAARVALKKAIVLLKAGVSNHGAAAAASHTGALAGSDSAIDALCSETGIHRAHSSEEFFDMLSVLSTQPSLLSDNIAIVTNAGGPGILATDAAEKAGLNLPALTPENDAKLKPLLPAAASTHNPIDCIGDANAERYEAALIACRNDINMDGIVVLLTPQVMTPCEAVAETIIRVMKTASLMPVTVCFMGGKSVEAATKILREHHISVFPTPERAVMAMAALRAQEARSKIQEANNAQKKITITAAPVPGCGIEAKNLLAGMSGLLDESTVQSLFKLYDLPLPKQALAKTPEDAVTLAEKIGYPLVAKISAKDIIHKTDIGCVRVNLKNKEEVLKAFTEIMANAKKFLESTHDSQLTTHPDGVLLQQFLPVGDEFIVGAIRDASFGPLILAGLGGIYTELFRDTAFRIAPVTQKTAYEMLADLKAWKLLLGMRGKPQSDIDALASLIERVSQMMMECPTIKELDLNPVIVSAETVVIADAKVILN